MHPPRLQVKATKPCTSIFSLLTHTRVSPFCPSFTSLFIHPPNTRSAHHASEGRANRAARGPGKRLGAKKQATELVVPGNIIFRQRGTQWFPGENCGMGRDHTIFAKEKGYVVYYRDRWRNAAGERKYIGVVFERGMTLPRPTNAPRIRRLGLVRKEREGFEVEEDGTTILPTLEGGIDSTTKDGLNLSKSATPPRPLKYKKRRYQNREANINIGKLLDRAKVKHAMKKKENDG